MFPLYFAGEWKGSLGFIGNENKGKTWKDNLATDHRTLAHMETVVLS